MKFTLLAAIFVSVCSASALALSGTNGTNLNMSGTNGTSLNLNCDNAAPNGAGDRQRPPAVIDLNSLRPVRLVVKH
jgi:hypothetical protein